MVPSKPNVMMTSSNGNIFRVTGPLCGEFTSLTIVYSTVYSDADQWKHKSSASLAFVRGIHRSRWIPHTKASEVPVNSPHKGQWRGAFMFSLICVWINGWVNNREAGELRRYRPHYDVTVMVITYAYSDPEHSNIWGVFCQRAGEVITLHSICGM